MSGPQTMDQSEGWAWFGRDAAGYDAGRLGYPAAIYDAIAARMDGIAGRSVFEIGPGTGLATRELLARGAARVVAAEPDAELAHKLPGYYNNAVIVEFNPIPILSVDFASKAD